MNGDDQTSIALRTIGDNKAESPSIAESAVPASTSMTNLLPRKGKYIELSVRNEGLFGWGDKVETGADENDIRYRLERKRPGYLYWQSTLRKESPNSEVVCTMQKWTWAMSFVVNFPNGVVTKVDNGFYYSMCQEFTSDVTKRSYKWVNVGSLPGGGSNLGLFNSTLPIDSQSPLARWENARFSTSTSGKLSIAESAGEDFELILATALMLADIARERRGSY